jgi:hypothetical protein
MVIFHRNLQSIIVKRCLILRASKTPDRSYGLKF